MIDLIGFAVADFRRSREFYVKALAPLGFGPAMDVTREQSSVYEGTGFSPPGRPQFWIGKGESHGGKTHIAFSAASRATVDAFYRAAIAAGGHDNGPPGVREHYHPNYYGAFVLDPDGHTIEAVCHQVEV